MVELLRSAALLIVDILDVAFLLRVLMSWFDFEENTFTELLYRMTEPLIVPFRMLYVKMNWFQQVPIDVPFLSAVISLSILHFVITLI